MDRKEIERERERLAKFRAEHKKLMGVLTGRYNYDPTPEQQAAYAKARVFWVREYPAFMKTVDKALEHNSHIRHCMAVVQRCFQDPQMKDSVGVLTDIGQGYSPEEAETLGQDIFNQYEAWLDRQEAALPSPVESAQAQLGSFWQWLKTRPDWIEAHPRTLLSCGAMVLAVLVLLGVVTPPLLHAIADLIRATRGN